MEWTEVQMQTQQDTELTPWQVHIQSFAACLLPHIHTPDPPGVKFLLLCELVCFHMVSRPLAVPELGACSSSAAICAAPWIQTLH